MQTFTMTTLLLAALRLQSSAAFSVGPSAGPRAAHSLTRASMVSHTETAPKVAELMQQQVTNELKASQFYCSGGIWFKKNDLEGFAAFMQKESEEERTHAMGILDFGLKRNMDLDLMALEAPPSNWNTARDVIESALMAEEANTKNLNKLADAAMEARDHALLAFLMPFHLEQVEAEASLEDLLAKVTEESKTPGLIRQLDRRMSSV
jgi:ferritin